MKTMDELPEQIRPSSLIAGVPQSPWDQGPTNLSGGSKPGNSASPVPSQPGGSSISKPELADYSNRPDRNYNGAGRATMPEPAGTAGMPRPQPVSANSWETTAGGGGSSDPRPTGVTEWRGGEKPEKP